jgi:NTE family protein
MTAPDLQRNGLVLALGGGGAAGLAHVGVLQVLQENAIPVRAIAGTSIGAEIGAFVAGGMAIDDLAALATSFDWKQTLQLFMPDLPTGGLVSGVNIVEFLRAWIGAQQIEDLAVGFAAVATDLDSGGQIVLDRGDLVDAVRASIAVPAVIAPFHAGSKSLVDGGVVNPLPFDVARRMFGGPVVAVAVHAGARDPAPEPPRSAQWPKRARQLLEQPWMKRVPGMRDWLKDQLQNRNDEQVRSTWTTRRVLDRVVRIMEAEILRLRAEANPPDLILAPRVGHIGLLEFYRAGETIAAGRRVAEENLSTLKRLLRSEP